MLWLLHHIHGLMADPHRVWTHYRGSDAARRSCIHASLPLHPWSLKSSLLLYPHPSMKESVEVFTSQDVLQNCKKLDRAVVHL